MFVEKKSCNLISLKYLNNKIKKPLPSLDLKFFNCSLQIISDSSGVLLGSRAPPKASSYKGIIDNRE